MFEDFGKYIKILFNLFGILEKYDKMKTVQSPFEAFHTKFWFSIILLFIQEVFLKRKKSGEGAGKKPGNFPTYSKKLLLFMTSWVILMYN